MERPVAQRNMANKKDWKIPVWLVCMCMCACESENESESEVRYEARNSSLPVCFCLYPKNSDSSQDFSMGMT